LKPVRYKSKYYVQIRIKKTSATSLSTSFAPDSFPGESVYWLGVYIVIIPSLKQADANGKSRESVPQVLKKNCTIL